MRVNPWGSLKVPRQIIPRLTLRQHDITVFRHANHIKHAILDVDLREIRAAIRIGHIGVTVLGHFPNDVK